MDSSLEYVVVDDENHISVKHNMYKQDVGERGDALQGICENLVFLMSLTIRK